VRRLWDWLRAGHTTEEALLFLGQAVVLWFLSTWAP
jgi:hypothetical protein